MDGVDEPAAGHRQAEAIPQQLDDPAEGEPTLLIEDDRERDSLRPELDGGGAERVGGLQRMAPLHAAVPVPALANRDPEFVDHRALHGQILLVLRDDAATLDRAAAVGTRRRQRCVVGHVHARRRTSMALSAIGTAGLSSRLLGVLFRQAPRKRRRLASRSTPRHLELFLQSLILAAQPIALDLRALQILAESFDFPRLIINDLSRVRRRVRRAPRHDMLMPDSGAQYKREMRINGELTR